jgi:hypothetical protein
VFYRYSFKNEKPESNKPEKKFKGKRKKPPHKKRKTKPLTFQGVA